MSDDDRLQNPSFGRKSLAEIRAAVARRVSGEANDGLAEFVAWCIRHRQAIEGLRKRFGQ